MLHVVINGTRLEQQEGRSVWHALRSAGIEVPALCHDDRLAPSGACRTCLVQIKGAPGPVTACSTALVDGMEIETHTPELERTRRGILEMLVRHYPAQAVRRFPDKPFHRQILRSGLITRAVECSADRAREDRSHPYIAVDMTRCIDCYRCVRICAEVQGQFVWHLRGRGRETVVAPDGPTLRESSCVGCGACVDTCPTGALADAAVSALEPPAQSTRTICPYCGVGCELDVATRDGRIVSMAPVLDAAVSKGHLCVKGRYAFGFVSAADRITEPMIRNGATWRRVSWNEARAFVVERLRRLIQRHGADSIGILGSARATNEDNYVAQKFARAVIGTNNVDCCARVCHAPSAAALKRALGAGLATNSFDDIEIARTILVCGANATEDHPVVGARIKQAALRGTRLIVMLDGRGLQWPCPDEQHPGTPILHRETFSLGPRAPLQTVDYRESPEAVTTQFPLVLMTGRSLYQFNAGTMTGRTLNNELRPSDVLDVSPLDADRYGLSNGQVVRVSSRYGSVLLPVCVNDTVNPGQLFATFQSPARLVNALTGPNRDEWTGTPEYKVTAVQIEAIGQ